MNWISKEELLFPDIAKKIPTTDRNELVYSVHHDIDIQLILELKLQN